MSKQKNPSSLPKDVESFWRQTEKKLNYKKLDKNIEVDIAIAGGGIAGITTAYLLAKAGKKVALLEARELISGTTGYTTSKLTAQHNLIYDDLINRYGQDQAKLYYQANMEGIALIKELMEKHHIDCDLEEQEAFVYTQDPKSRNKFRNEAEAYKKLGIEGEFLEDLPLDLKIEAAVMMRNQAQFHPVKYLNGLLREIDKMDGEVYEHSMVMDLEKDNNKIICKMDSPYTVTCNELVFATHFPTYEPNKFYSDKLEPESSYALSVKAKREFPDGMYINADLPKRTLRKMEEDGETFILVGGESHPTGDRISSNERYKNLATFAEDVFDATEVVHHWSSHDLISPDRIPFIGRLNPEEENIYVVTGFGKWGLTNATVGAKVLNDLILEKDNPYTELFSPQREIGSLKTIEPMEVSGKATKKQSSTIEKTEDLQKNQGAIVKVKEENVGAYKDNQGDLHFVDLSCTHLGCDVEWNDGDCTWDCPCHGSRFNAIGGVIEGPAVKPLKKIN